jgi:hypothetical protein
MKTFLAMALPQVANTSNKYDRERRGPDAHTARAACFVHYAHEAVHEY